VRLPVGETSSAFVERIQRLLSPPEPFNPVHQVVGPPHTGRGPTTHAVPRRERPGRVLLVLALIALGGGTYFTIERFIVPRHAGRESPIGEKSIAVLPFVDMSEKKDQEYFADGMAEEILDQLIKVPQLKVISRTSSFQYKNKSTDARTIGAAI